MLAAGSSLDRPKIASIPAVSGMRLDDQAPRATHSAEILALGPSCVSPTSQLKRERSASPEFAWIPGNLRDLSKGYFAPTFLSSSLTCPARQSGLCGSCLVCRNKRDVPEPARSMPASDHAIDHDRPQSAARALVIRSSVPDAPDICCTPEQRLRRRSRRPRPTPG